MKLEKYLLPLLLLPAACGDDEPVEDVDPEEVITTVELTLTDGTETLTATWRDLDGEGPGDPVITPPAPLAAGTTYDLQLTFLNETESPAEDVTEEIQEEAEEHQVLMIPSSDFLTATPTDVESDYVANSVGDDLPVGLTWSVQTDAAGTGTLRVVLKHLPPVGGTPQKTADVGLADGGTDADVSFDLVVE